MPLFEEDNTTISFRTSPEIHGRLLEIAAASGTTKHQAAKVLLAVALGSQGHEEVMATLGTIINSLESMKGALGRGIGAVLLNVTDYSDDEIKKWVFEIMLRPTEGQDGGGE